MLSAAKLCSVDDAMGARACQLSTGARIGIDDVIMTKDDVIICVLVLCRPKMDRYGTSYCR